jgi:hypothetical protein
MDTNAESKMFLNEFNERLQTKITKQKKEKAAKEKMEELQAYSIANGLPIPFWVAGYMPTFEEIEKELEGAKSAVACAKLGLKDDIFAQNLDFIRVPW